MYRASVAVTSRDRVVFAIFDNCARQLYARMHIELPKHVPQVIVDCVGREAEVACDLGVGQPVGDVVGHSSFCRCETC